MSVRVFVNPLMGHWQKKHRQNGTRALWRKLRLLCTEGMTILPPQIWNTDWRALAKWEVEEAETSFLAIELGYSYGGGWGAQELTKELAKEARRQKKTVEVWQALADPVGRFGYGPFWPLNTLNLSPWAGSWRKIKLHPAVTRCWWCDQRTRAPFGQAVVSRFQADVEYGGRFDEPHNAMDELPAYREAAAELVRKAATR